jgi:hypothetical protein
MLSWATTPNRAPAPDELEKPQFLYRLKAAVSWQYDYDIFWK